ncbi:MAG: stage II sporulation protein M [Aggregatilineales bacterium]
MTTSTNSFDPHIASDQTTRWATFTTTMQNALIITRREVRDSFRDWRILAPIFILTFLFPFLAQFVAARFSAWLTGFGAELIGERTIPFLLMIVGFFPISISLVIALETFVGEKERRSLEPLLSTPLTNTELYIGKTLSAMIPPLISSYGGMAVYLTTLLFTELAWRPQPMLIVQIVLLTTVQALVMVTGAVVVSSQTTSTRAANLLASFIIIPMTLIINGESIIMFLAPDADSPSGIGALWAIIIGMFVVCILLLRVGNAIFNREELLGRAIDQLNIFGVMKKIGRFARSIDDEGTTASNLIEWYSKGVTLSLRRLRTAMQVAALVFIVAFFAGFLFGQLEQWRLPLPPQDEFLGTDELSNATEIMSSFLNTSTQSSAMGFIILQNGRILLAAMILSIFTFGVASLTLTPLTYLILGYLLAQVLIAGYDPLFLFGAVFTHGIIEIPVIVIAAALGLRLGSIVTRPPRGETVGEAWMVAFGDTVKLTIALVIPGLIIAAFLEAFVTPRVVIALLGG